MQARQTTVVRKRGHTLTHLPIELETARLLLDRTQESDVVHASVAVECAKEQRHVDIVVHLRKQHASRPHALRSHQMTYRSASNRIC